VFGLFKELTQGRVKFHFAASKQLLFYPRHILLSRELILLDKKLSIKKEVKKLYRVITYKLLILILKFYQSCCGPVFAPSLSPISSED